MKLKPLNALLTAGIVLGGILNLRTAAERSRLDEKCALLARSLEDPSSTDGIKAHILALEDESRFSWRIHLPLYHNLHSSYEGASHSQPIREGGFIARARFCDTDDLRIYTNLRNVAPSMYLEDQKWEELLHGPWDKFHVEQLGLKDMEHIDADRSAVLLRLEVPPGVRAAKEITLLENSFIFELLFPGS